MKCCRVSLLVAGDYLPAQSDFLNTRAEGKPSNGKADDCQGTLGRETNILIVCFNLTIT